MRIAFSRRDLAGVVYIPGLKFEVERMSWDIRGGPAAADVLVSGPANRLGLVMQLLRCGASITDEAGGPAWWGYVNGIELSLDGRCSMADSLDDLANRIAVRYRDERISPGVNLGWNWQSLWAQDNQSVLEWGKKEQIYTKVPASPEETRSYRAALLELYKRPMLKAVSPAGGAGTRANPADRLPQEWGLSAAQPGFAGAGGATPAGVRGSVVAYARLQLRGWWSTLNWLYFSEGRGYAGFEGGGAIQNFGNLAASTLVSESFSVSSGWVASTLWAKIGKYGAPADDMYGYLMPNNAGVPDWPALATSAPVNGSAMNGDITWTRFDFSAPYSLAAGTTYWVMLGRSGALDALNYYRVSVDEGLPYAGGVGRVWNGGAWVARVPDADLVFQLTGREVTTDQIKTIADPASGAGQFLKGVFIQDASGVSGRLYRDGRERAGDEIQALLDQGNSAGRQLMAWISPERWLLVKLVPAAPAGSVPADLLMLASGELRDRSGGRLPSSFNPVGKWAQLLGVDQLGGDRSAPGCVLVTKASWENGRLTVAW